MKLDSNAVISSAKISGYLLAWRPNGDKSGFLSLAGYDESRGKLLETDIRRQLLPLDAEFQERTDYGDKYLVRGALTGPNGRTLGVISVWMIEAATGLTKFLTLYPDKAV